MSAMPQRLAPTNGRKTETRGLFPVACGIFYNLEQRQVGGLCCPFREACRAPDHLARGRHCTPSARSPQDGRRQARLPAR